LPPSVDARPPTNDDDALWGSSDQDLWVEAEAERRANALQDEAQWVASDDEFWTEAARTADHLQHASPLSKNPSKPGGPAPMERLWTS
jgi:hypothetical protein